MGRRCIGQGRGHSDTFAPFAFFFSRFKLFGDFYNKRVGACGSLYIVVKTNHHVVHSVQQHVSHCCVELLPSLHILWSKLTKWQSTDVKAHNVVVNINQTSLPTHVHTVLMSNLPDTASASKVQFYQPTAMLSFLSRLQGRNRSDHKWTASVTVHIFFLRSFKSFLGSAYICVIMHDIFIFYCLLMITMLKM